MDNLYKKGEMLRIQTKFIAYEGQFYEMTKDKSKISLYYVKELPHGKPCHSIIHFRHWEIQNIIKLKVSEKEFETIIKRSKTYKYINQLDKTFHDAMEDLNGNTHIGVSTDGADKGRKEKMPFLVMSTPHQIYIFDTYMMLHHAFDAGLKKLLEAKTPKKIVHDCRLLSDCLYHKHNVKLASVIDTQVGDVIIMRNKNRILPKSAKSLNDCLRVYLGLQKDIIQEKHDIVLYKERPLASNIQETLAKNIAFIHRLSEIINEEMFLPFVKGVECYMENIQSSDDDKASKLCDQQNLVPEGLKSAIEYGL